MLMDYNLFPRHNSKSHYANIPSGYYTLLICFIFTLLMFLVRKYLQNRTTQRYVKIIYELNPIFLICYFGITISLILFSVFFSQQERVVSVFTKRLGRISYVFTNFLIMVMFQEPLSLFKGLASYLEFVNLHIWLSRTIFGLSILHGFMFIAKWSSDPTVSIWDKLIVNKANLIGFIICIEICFMLVVSLKRIRQKSYKFFYFSHQLINLSFIILTPFHARPRVTFPFFIINLVLLTVYCVNKTIQSHQIMVLDKKEVPESRLYTVTIPASSLGDSTMVSPGSHIRINPYPIWNWKYWLLPSHPYTVVSCGDDEIKLIIKKTRFELNKGDTYRINGPFENVSITNFIKWQEDLNNIILVAGGSGISFILPIYHYLHNNRYSTISYKLLKMIWLVKSVSEFKHIRDNIGLPSEYFEHMEVFVTAEREGNSNADDNVTNFVNENQDDIELQNFIPIENKIDTNEEMKNNIRYGRINWELDLEDILNNDSESFAVNNNSNTKNYIIGCGPEQLIYDCEMFGAQHNYQVISEYYSL